MGNVNLDLLQTLPGAVMPTCIFFGEYGKSISPVAQYFLSKVFEVAHIFPDVTNESHYHGETAHVCEQTLADRGPNRYTLL